MSAQQASEQLANPALGNDMAKARKLLLQGADVGHDFYAAAQNAASGGHQGVLKLVLAVDPEFHETKQDALRSAARAGKADIHNLLAQSAGQDTNDQRRDLLNQFRKAQRNDDHQQANQALDKIVALMFPLSPRVE